MSLSQLLIFAVRQPSYIRATTIYLFSYSALQVGYPRKMGNRELEVVASLHTHLASVLDSLNTSEIKHFRG